MHSQSSRDTWPEIPGRHADVTRVKIVIETTKKHAASSARSHGDGMLRVGLIGSGKMGLNHLKAIREAGGSAIVGVADPAASEEDLRPHIGPDALVVASAGELLQSARPDVVHIVTPPATHTELALLAIRAGCHVYVEKPFAATTAEAALVIEEAERHTCRCAPVTRCCSRSRRSRSLRASQI